MKEAFHAGIIVAATFFALIFHADYAASVAPDNLLNSIGLHGPCKITFRGL
jgi:hypothetical protein